MEDDEQTYDIGRNAEDLGIFYIFVRYVLPLILAFALAIFLGFFVIYFLDLITPAPPVQLTA